MSKDKCVVLWSGGLDSTVLLHHMRCERGPNNVLAVLVGYGQRHIRELESAHAHAELVGQRVAEVGMYLPIRTSCLMDMAVPVPEGHYEAPSMAQTVVPNRNMVLLATAAAVAIDWGAHTVSYAAHGGDHAIYPDCRPEFADAMRAALRLCHYEGVELVAPFIGWTKAMVVARGRDLGVPMGCTWSCYKGMNVHCGKCGTCVERREAFQLAGVPDPTEYEP